MPRPRTSPAQPAPLPHGALLLTLLAVLVLAAGADTFRMGFFADDFLFLDEVRRMPVGEVLLGQHGILPWYRPLSRELYFYAVVAAGPAGVAVARLLGLACLLGAAWALRALGVALLGSGPAAGMAAALLVASSLSKFLVGWASGFQDLLATFLVLAALVEHARGHGLRSATCTLLAPFAKETGFLALPLLLLYAFLVERRRRFERWMLAQAGAAAVAAAVHLAVRAAWPPAPPPEAVARTAGDLGGALWQWLASLATPGLPPGPLAAAMGLVAGVATWLLLRPAGAPRGPGSVAAGKPPAGGAHAAPGPGAAAGKPAPAGRPAASASRAPVPPSAAPSARFAFVLGALVLNLAPGLSAFAAGSFVPRAHFLYPALAWVALLAAWALGQLPARAAQVLVTLLVTLNVWGQGLRMPAPDAAESTRVGPLGWAEAQRMWARTKRFSADVRAALAARPESVIVLYSQVPAGSWFQTGDGPATREVLHDPTARAYHLNRAPWDLPADRTAILIYDLEATGRVSLLPRDCDECIQRAVRSILQERPRVAHALASYCLSAEPARLYARYLRAAARLQEDGAARFAAELDAAGLLDTTGSRATDHAQAIVGRPDPGLVRAFARVLRAPLDPAAHATCADSFAARGADLLEALELRLALRLGPDSPEFRYRLGGVLARHGQLALARRELERAVALGGPREVAERARAALAQLPPGEAGEDER